MVVEDDRNLRQLMRASLEGAGYTVITAEDGEEALEKLEEHHADLFICDIMMPNMDGYELTQTLRESDYKQPVLMVTAKETLADKTEGFGVGADDYMVKPVDMEEMLLRVSALLRRARIANEHRLVIGNCVLDNETLQLTHGTEVIQFPPKEFYLLFKLLSYPKKIFTRQQLMDEIWGMDAQADERTVDVHIKRLREKTEGFGDFRIVTIRGLGYKAEKC
jgi:DNA-binding response OmpR family regulator